MTRRRRPALRALVLVLAVGLCALVGLGPAVAAPATSRTAGGASAVAAGIDDPLPLEPTVLRLLEQTTFVSPDDVLQVGLDVAGAPPGSTLTLRLHPRVTSRSDFLETAAGDGLRSVLRTYDDLPVDGLPRDADGAVLLDLQVVSEGAQPLAGFRIDEPGVYPLSLQLDDADGNEVDRLITHVVRLPAADDEDAGIPLATAVVVQVEAPPAAGPDGSLAVDAAGAAGALRALDAVVGAPDVPLTVAAVPESLVALAAEPPGGTTVEDLVDAMRGRQVLADTYVPLELSGWVAAGRDGEVAEQVDVGQRTLEDLLTVPAPTDTWLVDPTVDAEGLEVLHRLGTSRAIVPEPLLDPLDPRDFPLTMTSTFDVRTSAGTPVRAVMADEGLRLRLTSTDQPALAANRTLADLAVLAFDEPDVARGAVLLAPGGADTPRGLAPVLDQLAAAATPTPGGVPVLAATRVDQLFEQVAPADDPDDEDQVLVRGWTAAEPAPLDALPVAMEQAQGEIDSYRSMLLDGDDAAAATAQRLVWSAPDRRLATEDQLALLDGATTVVAARTAAVTAPEQGTVTLTASEASIPIVLDNGLDVPVEVEVRLQAEKLEFPDGDRVRATLAPGDNRLEVEVRTRASGAFPLEVAVTSPDGGTLLGETRVQVRSTAVSGLGLVLSIGAGLFLAVWWARNLRSGRRRKQLVSADRHPTGRPDGPDDD